MNGQSNMIFLLASSTAPVGFQKNYGSQFNLLVAQMNTI